MGNRSKYRRLPDLYIRGKELVFKDEDDADVVMWLQVLNPFESQECRNDAQTARARLVMALRDEGSREHDQLRGQYLQRGTEAAIEDLLTAKQAVWFIEATHAVEVDPEWAERMEVMRGTDIAPAEPISDDERSLLAKLNTEYMTEVSKRVNDERDYYRESLQRMDEAGLLLEYVDVWVSRRGDNIALIEYNLSEVAYGTRICDAVPDDEGQFSKASHAGCNHVERVYESRDEVRTLPEEMQRMLREAFDDLAMSARDAKNLGSKATSSDSSPVPAQQEDSTVSTSPTPALSTVPGT